MFERLHILWRLSSLVAPETGDVEVA